MTERSTYTVEAVAPKIRPFLEQTLQNAALDLDFEVCAGAGTHPEIEDPEVVVRFRGPDVELLLANRAELLLALEQLTMEMLRMPSEHHALLCFDAHDYRMLRVEELRMSALTAAEKVKRTKIPFHFNPMTSRERRIIHLALRNETAVRSESAGVGPQRQVVILPADMPMPTGGNLPPKPMMRRGGRRR